LTHADERRGEERGAAFPDRHRQWERQGQGTAFFLVPSVAFFVAFLGPFFLRAPSLGTPWSCKRNLPGFLFAIFSRDLFYCPFFASHMTWHACRLFLARRDMQRATIARDLLSISCSVLSYLSKKIK
jgi:hypothetical protein